MHIFEKGSEGVWDNTNCAISAITLQSLNMGHELPVVSLIIHAVFLVKNVRALHVFDGHHDPLCLLVKATTEAFYESEEANDVLFTAKLFELAVGFEFGREHMQTLVIDECVRTLHVFVIGVFPVLSF